MTVQNLLQIFEDSYQDRKDRPCFQYSQRGQWKTLTWNDVREKIQKVSNLLDRYGVGIGDRVCILSKTRYEWSVADFAILACGAVTVPIYDSNTPEQIAFIVENAEAVFMFVENEAQMQKLKKIWKNLPKLRVVVLFESNDKLLEENRVLSWRESLLLPNENGAAIYQKNLQALLPKNMASIVYTSGTTGDPKGAVLTHDNFIAAIEGGSQAFPFHDDMIGLIFLPLAHILGRVAQFYQIANGYVHAYAESIERLADNMLAIRPHVMVSVPRIFEKVYERIQHTLESASWLQKRIFAWAIKVGGKVFSFTSTGKKLPWWLALKNRLADRLVFTKIKQKLGGRLVFAISGGAPLSEEVGRFFSAAGFVILEGYGLTETTAANAVNRFQAIKIGTVGKPLSGVNIKTDDDGEILIKGRAVFSGYFKNEVATRDVFDSDGWFHTGDIGKFDDDGFLKITDRKKEIIVTAGGKKIAPQNIENLLKSDPYISQAVIHGDRRKFISALITLNRDVIESFAKKQQIAFENYADLVQNPKINALIRQSIEQKNMHLAQYETIKKFAILPQDFTIETGELTPSMKLKRKEIANKYKHILDGFYQD